MAMEQAPDQAEAGGTTYVLHLYISGAAPNSARAVPHLRDICERYLPGRYDLQIIDLYQQPELAKAARMHHCGPYPGSALARPDTPAHRRPLGPPARTAAAGYHAGG